MGVSGFGEAMETAWPASKVRETFLRYFTEECEHRFYASSPCVPLDDPTLLFANAGMNQFKPIFLGQADPASPLAALTRACNTQKCIRAGGKHNDLEDVGKDTYHHTFFEMLGNWSFGDYFKKEAIAWAFDLLVRVYGLPQERLYATYFQGDDSLGLLPDEEARELWLQFLPAERVLPFGAKDNFWEMGDVGPCGPCSEIHFDRIGDRDASSLVNADDPDVIEIWNLVFIQYNREPDKSLRPLPNKHVDTGMGFERVTSILQEKRSNYDTDVFAPLFTAIQEVYGCRSYEGKLGAKDVDGVDMAYRVLGDHIRTLSFAIADGAVPSNEGRGYVLRRILRRAVRYGQQFLSGKAGDFAALVDPLVNLMGEAFPELKKKREVIRDVIADEESAFGRTLQRGIEQFRKVADDVSSRQETIFPGKDAFFLYDTMGFPLDLTQLMAQERGLTIDEDAYQKAMEQAKEISRQDRNARSGLGGKPLKLEAEETDYLKRKEVSPTDDQDKYTWHKDPQCTIKAIFLGEKQFVETVADVEGEESKALGIVLDKTSFYAEAGGQVADTGSLECGNGLLNVADVQSFGGYVLHIGILASGSLTVGDQVTASVDYERRSKIAPNHTMTHVLNFALRTVLGEGADQKGSLVDPAKLRFDFANNKGLTEAQLENTQAICRDIIQRELPVFTRVVPLDGAKKINSLRSVFGEVYPDPVRVVSVGQEVDAMVAEPGNEAWMNHAIEFCGGTHLTNTRQASAFVLVEETAIAKGIRRIVAITGAAAVEAEGTARALQTRVEAAGRLSIAELESEVTSITSALNQATISATAKLSLRSSLATQSDRIKAAQKERSAALTASLTQQSQLLGQTAAESGARFIVSEMPELAQDPKLASKIPVAALTHFANGAVLFVYYDAAKSKLAVVAVCSPSAISAGLSADAWCSAAIEPLQGKGGGKPAAAQANATSGPDSIQIVLDTATSYANSQLA